MLPCNPESLLMEQKVFNNRVEAAANLAGKDTAAHDDESFIVNVGEMDLRSGIGPDKDALALPSAMKFERDSD